MSSRNLSSSLAVIFFITILLSSFVSSLDERVVIEFNGDKHPSGIRSFFVQDVRQTLSIENDLGDYVSAVVDEKEISNLRNNPQIKNIRKEKVYNSLLQDSVDQIESSSAWNLLASGLNLSGVGQTICIIDTGVNYSHPDLGGCYGENNASSDCKVLGGWDYCADDGTFCSGEDSDPMDVDGHGTNVSGIASANGSIVGVAPGSKIIMIKAGNASGSFFETDLEKSINWCVNNASKFNISVISMSLGGGQFDSYCTSDGLANEINNAVAQNISVVVATGNTGGGYTNALGGVASPACVQSATRVGAVNKTDFLDSYSFRNSFFQDILLAPGTSINSTYLSPWKYAPSSGTSMATPHVAGAIAIINQVLNLTGQEKTPSEIETLLANTGEQIIDSENLSQSYQRINVYEAVLSLDNIVPEINLMSPFDSTINLTQNQTFYFNTTDWQLRNATFYLWNSSDLYHSSSVNLTGTENSSSFSLTDLPYENYEWNVLVYDVNNNSAFASGNFSLTIGGVSVSINEPENNSYKNLNETNFNCSAISDENYGLSNLTLYLWNSSDLIYSNTSEISGVENSSSWIYELPVNDSYDWSCVAVNNNSQNVTSGNFSLIYDITYPEISTISISTTSSSATLTWNTSEETNLNIVSNTNLTNSSYSLNHSGTISELSASTTYEYNLTYCDQAGNCNFSNGSFSTSAAPVIRSSSGGGGGGSKIYNVELNETVSKTISSGDRIIFNKEGEKHTLTLKVLNQSANITIQSNPVNFILEIGESKKLNLSSPDFFDLLVKLENISSGKAIISLTEINESIYKYVAPIKNESEQVSSPFESPMESEIDWTLVSLGVVCLLIILVAVFERRLNWKRLKTKTTNKKNEKA